MYVPGCGIPILEELYIKEVKYKNCFGLLLIRIVHCNGERAVSCKAVDHSTTGEGLRFCRVTHISGHNMGSKNITWRVCYAGTSSCPAALFRMPPKTLLGEFATPALPLALPLCSGCRPKHYLASLLRRHFLLPCRSVQDAAQNITWRVCYAGTSSCPAALFRMPPKTLLGEFATPALPLALPLCSGCRPKHYLASLLRRHFLLPCRSVQDAAQNITWRVCYAGTSSCPAALFRMPPKTLLGEFATPALPLALPLCSGCRPKHYLASLLRRHFLLPCRSVQDAAQNITWRVCYAGTSSCPAALFRMPPKTLLGEFATPALPLALPLCSGCRPKHYLASLLRRHFLLPCRSVQDAAQNITWRVCYAGTSSCPAALFRMPPKTLLGEFATPALPLALPLCSGCRPKHYLASLLRRHFLLPCRSVQDAAQNITWRVCYAGTSSCPAALFRMPPKTLLGEFATPALPLALPLCSGCRPKHYLASLLRRHFLLPCRSVQDAAQNITWRVCYAGTSSCPAALFRMPPKTLLGEFATPALPLALPLCSGCRPRHYLASLLRRHFLLPCRSVQDAAQNITWRAGQVFCRIHLQLASAQVVRLHTAFWICAA